MRVRQRTSFSREGCACSTLKVPSDSKFQSTPILFELPVLKKSAILLLQCNHERCSKYVLYVAKDAYCPALSNPQNGKVIAGGYNLGDVAAYSCNAGYRFDGLDANVSEQTRTCVEKDDVSGAWTNSEPQCVGKYCYLTP